MRGLIKRKAPFFVRSSWRRVCEGTVQLPKVIFSYLIVIFNFIGQLDCSCSVVRYRSQTE
ncbi:MAG: hypothetical protein CM1200mP18_00580 [Gammaproteobacteria bacterium]|nr:MAG: hypothetical protein CM1200mP18_00580 [Gammaproteobacteria bacterium]